MVVDLEVQALIDREDYRTKARVAAAHSKDNADA